MGTVSVVTTLILSFSSSEDRSDGENWDIMRAVDALVGQHASGHQTFFNANHESGGSKCLQRPTFFAGFNHLNIEAFIEDLGALPWRAPQEAQLFINGDSDNLYRLTYPCRRDMPGEWPGPRQQYGRWWTS